MDRSESYVTVKLGKKDTRSPSRAEPDVLYAQVNFKTPSASRVQTDRDGLNSTYSDLNFQRKETRIDEGEGPPIASGSSTAQKAAQERESKVKIGNRPYRLICLLCLVTSALIVTVASLSIHVLQIRQSKNTSDQNCHELNSTLQSKLSALNSNLSVLRLQFTEMETKYRSVNETKAQICELLTSRREQTCSEDWVTNGDRCYYASKFETSSRQAIQECSNRDSRLLEINTRDEASFVSRRVLYKTYPYWIGKCEVGNVSLGLMHNVPPGTFNCKYCESYVRDSPCKHVRRFICEKSAPLFPDVPAKIQGLCQQPVEST
ncbi:C-type lectin domain family 12 member A-like [Hypanus sabinus]|uniref:C-type lectin domain family 12 member A-like n=1 Tax=Hypanus sabinus TaxID=79690 RepID=UPI0028C505F2|nr:C-type lectin domain family 12 member A-like [Hypanus sabinus]